MSDEDFLRWKDKLEKISNSDQSELVVSKARKLNKQNKISKNLMKKISLLEK